MLNTKYETKLPSLLLGNEKNLLEGGFPCCYTDGGENLGEFICKLRNTVRKDRRMFFYKGVPYMASINWLRDHVHEMKAYKHWDTELCSYIEFAAENQSEEGFFYEIVKPLDDTHVDFVDENCIKRFYDDHLLYIRLEIEADVEYLMVEGAMQIYQVTGDDKWIKKILPHLEKGIDYCTSNEKRFDKAHGLVKRAFTIDTWDFVANQSDQDRRIHDYTPMSIMHGDNSGVYQAMKQIACLNRRFGNEKKAEEYECRAKTLQKNLNKYCWNGRFFLHQLHLNHKGLDGADESKILSLSNTYDINRGITTPEQAKSIIDEYKSRRGGEQFAEWFSINPPYENFGTGNPHTKNKYINGGIASFTAGELAKAAFKNYEEAYGWDILRRVASLVRRDNNLYFLYDPITGENMGGGPSGWGAAAILAAIDEGLAGIVDGDVKMNILEFSPRFAVTEYREVRYISGYEMSKTMVETIYKRDENSILYLLSCPSEKVICHIMLPQASTCRNVLLDGEKIGFELSGKNNSRYVDFSFSGKKATGEINGWKVLPKYSILIEL